MSLLIKQIGFVVPRGKVRNDVDNMVVNDNENNINNSSKVSK